MKLNVKLAIKVDGEIWMEENLTVADNEFVARICDAIEEAISVYEGVLLSDGHAVERVEPTFQSESWERWRLVESEENVE